MLKFFNISIYYLIFKAHNKHKKALDLIYEYRTDGKMQLTNAIKDVLKSLSKEGKIIYDEEWDCVFRTKEMDSVLPLLEEPKSSWESLNVYSYWFNIQDGRFYVVFELAGWNMPKDEMNNMLKIIDNLKLNDKRREEFRYKRVFRTKWYNLNDSEDIKKDTDKAVRAAVKEILNMQEKLLISLNQL